MNNDTMCLYLATPPCWRHLICHFHILSLPTAGVILFVTFISCHCLLLVSSYLSLSYLVTAYCWRHLICHVHILSLPTAGVILSLSGVGTYLQVVAGGDLDINCYVAGPPAVGVIVSTHRERQGSHNFKVEIAGRCDRK